MKNGYNIFWTDFALKELENTIEYIEQNWSEKEIKNLAEKLEETLNLISKNPDIFQVSEFKKDGLIMQRANHVLDSATNLLSEIASIGIFETLEKGIFAGIKRPKNGGKGLKGVALKNKNYTNPILSRMLLELKEDE